MIKNYNNGTIVDNGVVAFTFSTIENQKDLIEIRTKEREFNWSNYSYSFIDDFIIHPFGTNNNLPEIIRNIIQENYIAPGLLTKKKLLLWGQGPKLYSEVVLDKEIFKDWKDYKDSEAKEIYQWLKGWDYETYLDECITSFNYVEGVFSEFVLNKGSRLNNPFIKRINHIPANRVRLASKFNGKPILPIKKYHRPTNAIITDYSFNFIGSVAEYQVYPLFDNDNVFEYKRSIGYSKISTFLQDVYTLPDIYGSLEWLKRSTAIPLILKALSENSVNLKYHIESPSKYWEAKADMLRNKCSSKNILYKEEMLEEYKMNTLEHISNTLSSIENTGKFIHTEKIYDTDGTNLIEAGWSIKEIPLNSKDFIEGQMKISERADTAVAASINIHSSLGNITPGGKADSGSEQLYAYMIYLLTANDLPEMIICKHINQAIKANFPQTDLRVGFYHKQPQRQSDVSSQDRIENKI